MIKRWPLYRSVLIKGLQWSFISSLFNTLLGLVYYIVLAKYLDPADFGAFSLGLVFLGFVDFFSGAGASAIIIQNKNINDKHYNAFFWLNICIGILFSLVLFGSSSLISSFFKIHQTKEVIQIISVAIFVQSLSLLHHNILRKKMEIATLEKIELAGTFSQVLSGIILASSGFGVLSLPIAFIISKCVITIGNLIAGFRHFIPKWEINFQLIYPFLKLGSYQTFEKFFNYIRINADKFLIGKFLGAEPLGIYSIGQKFVDLPLSKINPTINKILFPYFSRLQLRPKIISAVYSQVTSFIVYLLTPFLLAVVIFANPIVKIILGEEYIMVAEIIRILSILGLLRSFSNIGGNILNALGKFRVGFIWNLWWSLSFVGFLLLGFFFHADLIQITWLILGVNLISFVVWHKVIHSHIKLPYVSLVKKFIRISLVTMFILSPFIFTMNYWISNKYDSIVLIFMFFILSVYCLWLLRPYYKIIMRNKVNK